MTKMHAIGPTGQGHIDAIIDDHTRSRSTADSDKIADEHRQVDRLEVTFADLNEVDIRFCSPLRLLDEPLASNIESRGFGAETTAIGHEAKHDTTATLMATGAVRFHRRAKRPSARGW